MEENFKYIVSCNNGKELFLCRSMNYEYSFSTIIDNALNFSLKTPAICSIEEYLEETGQENLIPTIKIYKVFKTFIETDKNE